VVTTEVFGPGPDGRAIPRHLPEQLRDQLARVGYDARNLVPYIEAGRGAWVQERQPIDGDHGSTLLEAACQRNPPAAPLRALQLAD
jgi:hypothetical protein